MGMGLGSKRLDDGQADYGHKFRRMRVERELPST